MRSLHLGLLVAGICLCLSGALGQDNKNLKSKPSTDETAPNSVEVRFADGSVVKMVLLTDTIEIGTRYGKLKVAVHEIRRIDFGLRVSEGTLKRVDAALAALGNPEFTKREAATKELLALKEAAYPVVRQACKSSDPEVARRARDILKKMTDRTPVEQLRVKKQDTILASEFPIVGHIETTPLKARNPYFGEVLLQLAELRSIRWLGSERDTQVQVDAAKYGGQQEAWLDSEIEVAADVGLEITASGTVDLWPMAGQAGVWTSTPAGTPANGGGFVFVGAKPVAAGVAGHPPGALLGRIGDKGKVFVVGTKHESVPTEEGRLYLRIAPSPWGNESTGTYDVRVTVGGTGGR
jgi:hypothetical protein